MYCYCYCYIYHSQTFLTACFVPHFSFVSQTFFAVNSNNSNNPTTRTRLLLPTSVIPPIPWYNNNNNNNNNNSSSSDEPTSRMEWRRFAIPMPRMLLLLLLLVEEPAVLQQPLQPHLPVKVLLLVVAMVPALLLLTTTITMDLILVTTSRHRLLLLPVHPVAVMHHSLTELVASDRRDNFLDRRCAFIVLQVCCPHRTWRRPGTLPMMLSTVTTTKVIVTTVATMTKSFSLWPLTKSKQVVVNDGFIHSNVLACIHRWIILGLLTFFLLHSADPKSSSNAHLTCHSQTPVHT